MTINNIIIVGCNIIGLYSALRCLDNGYKVTIIDKLSKEILSYKKNLYY